MSSSPPGSTAAPATVERRTLTVKARSPTLPGKVGAVIPCGGVTVEYTRTDPRGELVATRAKIKDDNAGNSTLTKRPKGEYACAIAEVRDADGKVVCDQPVGKRVVTVK